MAHLPRSEGVEVDKETFARRRHHVSHEELTACLKSEN